MSRYSSTLAIRLVVVLSGTCVMITATPTRSEDDEQAPRRFRDPYFKTLEFAKSLVKDRPVDELVDITFEELPEELQSQMYSCLARSIKWSAHPQTRGRLHKATNLRVRVYGAYDDSQDDLIDYMWNTDGMPMRAVSSRNAIRLEFPLSEIERNRALDEHGRGKSERARGWLSEVFRLQGRDSYKEQFSISIPCPRTLEDGANWSSNPERRINSVGVWHERIDAYVEKGVLCVLTYKKPPNLPRYQDGAKWFDDDFRALIHEKAREQGKVPPEQPNPGE